jgi:hypothetical protein
MPCNVTGRKNQDLDPELHMEIIFHYRPELTQLLIQTIPLRSSSTGAQLLSPARERWEKR